MSGLYGAKHGRVLKAPIDWAKCGTVANYRGHLRRGEKPCHACREANRRHSLERYYTRKAIR